MGYMGYMGYMLHMLNPTITRIWALLGLITGCKGEPCIGAPLSIEWGAQGSPKGPQQAATLWLSWTGHAWHNLSLVHGHRVHVFVWADNLASMGHVHPNGITPPPRPEDTQWQVLVQPVHAGPHTLLASVAGSCYAVRKFHVPGPPPSSAVAVQEFYPLRRRWQCHPMHVLESGQLVVMQSFDASTTAGCATVSVRGHGRRLHGGGNKVPKELLLEDGGARLLRLEISADAPPDGTLVHALVVPAAGSGQPPQHVHAAASAGNAVLPVPAMGEGVHSVIGQVRLSATGMLVWRTRVLVLDAARQQRRWWLNAVALGLALGVMCWALVGRSVRPTHPSSAGRHRRLAAHCLARRQDPEQCPLRGTT